MADSINNLTVFNHNEKGNPHPQYSNEGIRSANYTDASSNAYLPMFDFKVDNKASDDHLYRIYMGFKAVDEFSDNNHGILNVTLTHTVDWRGYLISLIKNSWDVVDPDTDNSTSFEYISYSKNLGDNVYEVKSYIHLTGKYKRLTIISPWVYVPNHVKTDNREYLPNNSRVAIEEQTAYFFDPINQRNFIDDETFKSQIDGFTKIENQ